MFLLDKQQIADGAPSALQEVEFRSPLKLKT
jgi:hypothetical protein